MTTVAEVAMTPAGTLIRAPFGDVATYNKRPDKQGQKPNILEKNETKRNRNEPTTFREMKLATL